MGSTTARCLVLTCAALCVAACGEDMIPIAAPVSCEGETRADAYSAGLTKDGAEGMVRIRLMDANPGPPDQGNNQWTFVVEDMAGARMDDVTIRARAWMPDHGHGSVPLDHTGRRLADGQYGLGPMNFFMPGFWTVTMSIESSAGTDEVVYGFCLEG